MLSECNTLTFETSCLPIGTSSSITSSPDVTVPMCGSPALALRPLRNQSGSSPATLGSSSANICSFDELETSSVATLGTSRAQKYRGLLLACRYPRTTFPPRKLLLREAKRWKRLRTELHISALSKRISFFAQRYCANFTAQGPGTKTDAVVDGIVAASRVASTYNVVEIIIVARCIMRAKSHAERFALISVLNKLVPGLQEATAMIRSWFVDFLVCALSAMGNGGSASQFSFQLKTMMGASIYEAYEKISKVFMGKNDQLFAQAPDPPSTWDKFKSFIGVDASYIPAIMAATVTALLGGLFSVSTFTNFGEKISKAVVNFGNFVRAGTSIKDACASQTAFFTSFMYEVFGFKPDDPEFEQHEAIATEVTEAIDKANVLINAHSTDATITALHLNDFYQHIVALTSLQSRLNRIAEPAKFIKNLPVLASRLAPAAEKLRSIISGYNNGGGRKVEPVCVYFTGPPGVGKSAVAAPLLLAGLEEKCETRLETYTRTMTKHWDGYIGQPVVIYDDMLAYTKSEDASEFILCKSSSANILPKADLDSKGMRFTSSFIIANSNLAYVGNTPAYKDSLADPAAFERRRDFLVRITDPLFEATGNRTHWRADGSHLQMHLLPSVHDNKRSRPVPVTMNQLIEYAFERHLTYIDDYSRWLNRSRAIAQRFGQPAPEPDANTANLLGTEGGNLNAAMHGAPLFDNSHGHALQNYCVEGTPAASPCCSPEESSVGSAPSEHPSEGSTEEPTDAESERSDDSFRGAVYVPGGANLHHAHDLFAQAGVGMTVRNSTHGAAVLMVGQAGLGKSTIAVNAGWKRVLTLADYETLDVDDVCYFDDATVSQETFDIVKRILWRHYEDPCCRTFVVCSNDPSRFFQDQTNRSAFYRRFTKVLNFQFRRSWFGVRYDLTSTNPAQPVTFSKYTAIYCDGKEVTRGEVVDFIESVATKPQRIVAFSEVPRLSTKQPGITIHVDDSLSELLLLTKPQVAFRLARRMTSQPPTNIVRDVFVDVVSQIGIMQLRGNDVESMLKQLNEFGLESAIPPTTACFRDHTLVLFNIKDTNRIVFALYGPSRVVDQGNGQYAFGPPGEEKIITQKEELMACAHLPSFVKFTPVETEAPVVDYGVLERSLTPRILEILFNLLGTGFQLWSALADWDDASAPNPPALVSAPVCDRPETKPTEFADSGSKIENTYYLDDNGRMHPMFVDSDQGIQNDAIHIIHSEALSDIRLWKENTRARVTATLHAYGSEPQRTITATVPIGSAQEICMHAEKGKGKKKSAARPSGSFHDYYEWDSSMDKWVNKKTRNVWIPSRDPDDYMFPRYADQPADTTGYIAEAMTDPSARDIISKTGKNVCYMRSFEVWGLMLYGNIGVTVAHAWPTSIIQTKVEFKGIEYDAQVARRDPDRDILSFKIVNPGFESVPSMKRQITALDDQVDDFQNKRAFLCIPEVMSANSLLVTPVVMDTVFKHSYSNADGDFNGILYRPGAVGATYDTMVTKPGDCGSFLIMNDTKTQKKLLAIHTGANTTCGVAALITSAIIPPEAQDKGPAKDYPRQMLAHKHFQAVDEPSPVWDRTGWYLGQALDKEGKPYRRMQQEMTRLYPSILASDEFSEEVTQPAILSNRDPRAGDLDIKGLSFSKWRNQVDNSDHNILELVGELIGDEIIERIQSSGVKLRILSLHEALNGCNDYPLSRSMARDTSPGFPYSMYGGKKQDFLAWVPHGDDGYWTIDESKEGGQLLKTNYGKVIQAAKTGKRYPCLFQCNLKDEPRKMAKIEARSTRSFVACPFDFNIVQRRYFNALHSVLPELRQHLPPQVGFNPHGDDPTILYNQLTKFSEEGWDIDFKAFDATVPSVLFDVLVRIYQKCYRHSGVPENELRAMANLYDSVKNCLLLLGRTVIQPASGQPSGQAGTAIDNSLFLWILFMYCWMLLVGDTQEYRGFSVHDLFLLWKSNVSLVTYGDDVVLMVAQPFRRLYNFAAIQTILLNHFGMTITSGAKDENSDIRHISKLTFLKRSFRHERGVTTMPLELASLQKAMSYVRSKPHIWEPNEPPKFLEEETYAIAQAVLLEARYWGKPVFDKFRAHIVKRYRERASRAPLLPTYQTAGQLETRAQHEHLVFEDKFSAQSKMAENKTHNLGGEASTQSAPAVAGDVRSDLDVVNAAGLQPGPMPNLPEAEAATGFESCDLPAQFYSQPFYRTTISWKTTQQKGSILFSNKITPNEAFPHLKHMMPLFGRWTGGFCFTVSIAGTGFNAGRLIGFYLPPFMDLDDIDDIENIMYNFGYDLLDVKAQNNIELTCGDMNVTKFHYTRQFKDNSLGQLCNHGGTFVIAVALPLVAGSGALDAVNVLVRMHCAPDFKVGILVPPSSIPDGIEGRVVPDLFDAVHEHTFMVAGKPTALITRESTWSPKAQSAIVVDLDIDEPSSVYAPPSFFNASNTVLATPEGAMYKYIDAPAMKWPLTTIPKYYSTGVGGQIFNPITGSVGRAIGVGFGVAIGTIHCEEDIREKGNDFVVAIDSWKQATTTSYTAQQVAYTAPFDESIVEFTDSLEAYLTQPFGDLVTRQQFEALYNGEVYIPLGNDALFDIRDAALNVVIGSLRFTRKGFFTTNLSPKVVLPLDKITLQYTGIIPTSSPLPKLGSAPARALRVMANLCQANPEQAHLAHGLCAYADQIQRRTRQRKR